MTDYAGPLRSDDASASRIPGRVRVGTVVYRVTTDETEWVRAEHQSKQAGAYGHSNHQLALICLNPNSTAAVQRQTLWHELLHALHETVMGAPDWRGLGKDQSSREESVVRSWEHPTLALLRDNAELVAYLTGAD